MCTATVFWSVIICQTFKITDYFTLLFNLPLYKQFSTEIQSIFCHAIVHYGIILALKFLRCIVVVPGDVLWYVVPGDVLWYVVPGDVL